MNLIHERAIISQRAELGENNTIGPNVVIDDEVTIGSNNVIAPGAVIYRGTTIGDGNKIHVGAVIGDEPQDTAFSGPESFVTIGDNNVIREYCTIHRGTKEQTSTVVGNDCFLMAYSHVAHNCELGSKVILVNAAMLAGYVIVGDNAFISSTTVIHQFVRIGAYAILAGMSALKQDLPPFMLASGRPATVQFINVVGMRRGGIDAATRTEIKKAYKLLFRSGLNTITAIEQVQHECSSAEVAYLIDFIQNSKRGILRGGRERESFE